MEETRGESRMARRKHRARTMTVASRASSGLESVWTADAGNAKVEHQMMAWSQTSPQGRRQPNRCEAELILRRNALQTCTYFLTHNCIHTDHFRKGTMTFWYIMTLRLVYHNRPTIGNHDD